MREYGVWISYNQLQFSENGHIENNTKVRKYVTFCYYNLYISLG